MEKRSSGENNMLIVLDTQAWLWWLHDPTKLSPKASKCIKSAEKNNAIRVSVISIWEIATKQAFGKLVLPIDIVQWFEQANSYPGVIIEPLLPADAIGSTRLPGVFHKDPADRIIVTLARRLNAGLVTSDRLIQTYPHVKTVW